VKDGCVVLREWTTLNATLNRHWPHPYFARNT
jgi:hypothetical protein